MKKIIKRVRQKRAQQAELKKTDGIRTEPVPRITNNTVAAHREEVLGSARKYIYPLQHSKHRIVIISTTLIVLALVAFFTYCTLALYRFQSSSSFLYQVTRVVPFPIARVGSDFVAYENYLFELRHYIHYYENQTEVDFDDPSNQAQLAEYRQRALDRVINDAYIKKIAQQNSISVSEAEVDQELAMMRRQNRLGSSERVFEDVLRDYWGWSVDDFRRKLRSELLAQKVVAELDTDTQQRANSVLSQLMDGADFGEMAAEHSDDPGTKDNDGEFGFLVDQSNNNLTAQTTDELFRLEPGEISGVVNIGYALEILKNIERNGDRIRGAHIVFNFESINRYINDMKEEQPARAYISPPAAPDFEDSQVSTPAIEPAE